MRVSRRVVVIVEPREDREASDVSELQTLCLQHVLIAGTFNLSNLVKYEWSQETRSELPISLSGSFWYWYSQDIHKIWSRSEHLRNR